MSLSSLLTNAKLTITLPAGGMTILCIICLWAIFEKRGEEGWTALIPFYRDYVFGKVSKEPKTGKRLMIFKLLSVFVAIGAVIAFFVIFVGGVRYWDDNTGMMSYQPNYPAVAIITAIVLALALIVITVLILIWQIKLYYRFTVVNRAPGWITLVFIFLLPLALVYFAFVRGTDLDPFPPQIHNDI